MRYKYLLFWILILLIVKLMTGCGILKKPLVTIEPTLLKAGEDVNAIKNEVKELKGDMSAVKLDIPELKKLLEANIQAQAEIKAQLDTNLKAIAGVNNKIEETKITVGRDMTQVNEKEVMIAYMRSQNEMLLAYIKGLGVIIATLLSIIYFVIRTLLKRNLEKDFYKKQTILHINSPDELQHLEEEQKKFIELKRGKRRQ